MTAKEQITAPDGMSIVVHSLGAGPGIVVVHGGGVTIDVYRRLAAGLADRFTVHLYNRRGRADAPARSKPYTVEQDVGDLAVVLEHTDTGNVIGHSSGGFIALRAALRTMGDLLAMTLDESELIRAHDGPADQWVGVTAEVLLACGADGPPYYTGINEALAGVLPRARTVQIPRSGHDAINRARPQVVNALAAFFGPLP